MPVSSSSVAGAMSVKAGASRWMGRYSVALTGPLPSIGSPMTLNMRPSVASPTGIFTLVPVSAARQPRCSPSVEKSEMQRTVLSPSCCTASMTMRRSPVCTSMALLISGSFPAGNCTSTTGPMTLLTIPFSIRSPFVGRGAAAAVLVRSL